jgi:hypothetical protein
MSIKIKKRTLIRLEQSEQFPFTLKDVNLFSRLFGDNLLVASTTKKK